MQFMAGAASLALTNPIRRSQWGTYVALRGVGIGAWSQLWLSADSVAHFTSHFFVNAPGPRHAVLLGGNRT